MPEQPEFVRVRITVKEEVPVLQGTTATIAGVGFTGVSQINLDGAIKGAPPITEVGPYGAPVIPTKPGALGELLNSAPQLLQQLSTLTERMGELLDDQNQKSLGEHPRQSRSAERLARRSRARICARRWPRAASRCSQAGIAARADRRAGRDDERRRSARSPPICAGRSPPRSAAWMRSKARSTRRGRGCAPSRPRRSPRSASWSATSTEMSEALTGVATKLDRGGAGALHRRRQAARLQAREDEMSRAHRSSSSRPRCRSPAASASAPKPPPSLLSLTRRHAACRPAPPAPRATGRR